MIRFGSLLLLGMVLLLGACSKDDGNPATPDYTPPLYAPNCLLVTFEDGVLNYDLLAYDGDLTTELRVQLRAQRFSVDSLILLPGVRKVLHEMHVTGLRRITCEHPYRDTLVYNQDGDIVRSHRFNQIFVELDPDPGMTYDIPDMCNTLEQSYWYAVITASPNWYYFAE